MRGIGRIKKAVRIIRRHFRPAAVILMYHRIADLSDDPHRLAVAPANFAQHLTIIREDYHPMRLVDLIEALRRRQLPRKGVAITFDDGYVDNFSQARLRLESAMVPATVFVSSGSINSTREFWWDDLDRILLRPDRLPECLSLSIQGRSYKWRVKTKEKRLLALMAIRDLIRPLPAIDRDQVLYNLIDWAGLECAGRPDCRPMTEDELIKLSQSPYVDIGAHTVTHPVLASLPREGQYDEVFGSRERLQAILGKPVSTFAYPYGNPTDFSDDTVNVVKMLGFAAAVTTIQGAVESGDDLFRLRRCEVNNWGADEFRYHLSRGFLT